MKCACARSFKETLQSALGQSSGYAVRRLRQGAKCDDAGDARIARVVGDGQRRHRALRPLRSAITREEPLAARLNVFNPRARRALTTWASTR